MKHPSSSLRAGPKKDRPGTAGPPADGNDVTASANDGLRRAGACAHIHNCTANLGNKHAKSRKIFFFFFKECPSGRNLEIRHAGGKHLQGSAE